MKQNDIKHIYFIGIGGIGMSALARYFHAKNVKVSGYDKTQTDLTRLLESEGMHIHYVDDVSLIPKDIDMVVYTPAIPQDHKELNFLRSSNLTVLKRSEVLGLISQDSYAIAIAGTHGKTTTSTMVTHILKVGGKDVSAFLGGISTDYGTNCLIGTDNTVVMEADEYDRSFLRLHPSVATISSMDADHLDIYGTREEMIKGGFAAFTRQIQKDGHLIIKHDLIKELDQKDMDYLSERHISLLTFGTDPAADLLLSNVAVSQGKYTFDYTGMGHNLEGVELNLPGMHNVENACVALSVALLCGVKDQDIRTALAGFKGIKRRFEKIYEGHSYVYIDDYAHHPGEIRMAIDAARSLYPAKHLTVVFQPHLYSRTRDFDSDFALELDKSDSVILMDIYPARELPLEGVTSDIIFDKLKNPNKIRVNKDNLIDLLDDSHFDVLMTLGAGDIDVLVPDIHNLLMTKDNQ
jgi:UDP-N-acetylmuramate--alanine ligase